MPFSAFHPLPAGRSDTTSTPPLSPSTPPASSGGAQATLNAGHQSHVLRIDNFPPEIVVRIAQYLRPNDALALSNASRGMFHALGYDIVAPLRLAERIQWVNSASGFLAALSEVKVASPDQRRGLFRLLKGRIDALHPQLREAARSAFQPHEEPPVKPLRIEIPGADELKSMRQNGAHDEGALLDKVLASPPDLQARLLRVWFASHGSGLLAPSVDAWPRILQASLPSARGKVLAMMANCHCEGEAFEMLLCAARDATDEHGRLPADHAGVLEALASALSTSRNLEPERRGQLWDEVFSLALLLPLDAQPKVMSELTELLHQDGSEPPNDDATTPPPRWNKFIVYVSSSLAAEDAAGILGKLAKNNVLDAWDEEDTDPHIIPIVYALYTAAQTLPEKWCARLLADVVDGHPDDTQITIALWDGAFHASEAVGPSAAMPLYEKLAEVIGRLPDGMLQEARWDALCQRIGTSAEAPSHLLCLMRLASLDVGKRSLTRRALLARIGKGLPPEDRARLCTAMTVTRAITPALWRAQVMEMAELPTHVRQTPATLLAQVLFRYPGTDGLFEATAQEFAPGPGDFVCAQFPRDPVDALNKLSDILCLLPLAHRGALLLRLSTMERDLSGTPMPWSEGRVRWLLGEVLKLAPIRHHGIGVVTNVAKGAALTCPTEADVRAILPRLQTAVRWLPVEARASAFMYLGALTQRFRQDQQWVYAEATFLPPEDQAALAPTRKRKDAPE